VVLLIVLTPGARAANVDVAAKTGFQFAPHSVTITVGDTVTWTNQDVDYHNVLFDDGQFDMPPDPALPPWSVSRTFTAPGTYTYYCEAHKDVGMTGTVLVTAPPAGGGGGGGGSTPPPAADTAPVASLSAASTQRVAKLFVRASMSEAGTLAASGTVSVPGAAKVYKLRRASRSVTANQQVKLRLKLSARALRAAKRALRRGRRIRAKVSVTATDMTGHDTIRRQTIRLKR